jgi:hypothetical protein
VSLKESWLDVAEVIDALRIFPRLLIGSYMSMVGYVIVYLMTWYSHLEPVARSVEVTAFYSMLTGGLLGLAAYVFKIYSDGGRDWSQRYASDPSVSKSHSG